MIRLTKLPKPPVLAANAARWTSEYATYRTTGRPRAAASRYRHPQIKVTLSRETHEKCAYCESKVTQVYPGDAEHIVPKSVRPDLVVDWDNLTFVCWQCNNAKGQWFDPNDPILNPYVDDPSAHLQWIGPVCWEVLGDTKGQTTVIRLRLSRQELVERRAERIAKIMEMARVWAALPEGPTREALAEQIRTECHPDREYSAATNAVVTGIDL